MKTSKLIYVVGGFFVLMLAATTAFGQGRGTGNRHYQEQSAGCVYSIAGLTEKQQEQVEKMQNKHQEVMAELREKRRSTINEIEKSEIRTSMLKKVEAHRKAVRSVLTEEQQKEYDQLPAYGNYGRNQNLGRGRANGNPNVAQCGNRSSNFARGNRNACYYNSNFRGRGANFQQGYGRGAGNRKNLGRRNNQNFRSGWCVNAVNVDTSGLNANPEKESE